MFADKQPIMKHEGSCVSGVMEDTSGDGGVRLEEQALGVRRKQPSVFREG